MVMIIQILEMAGVAFILSGMASMGFQVNPKPVTARLCALRHRPETRSQMRLR